MAADIVGNFHLGADPGADPNPYTSYSFDVTSLLSPGGIYQLRFAEVDNQYFFNMGIDNVSIVAETSTVVPEPGTLALMGMGGIGLVGGWYRKRRNAARSDRAAPIA